jgi:hypothetical protein
MTLHTPSSVKVVAYSVLVRFSYGAYVTYNLLQIIGYSLCTENISPGAQLFNSSSTIVCALRGKMGKCEYTLG